MTELEGRKAELVARRDELLARLDAIRRDYARGLSQDEEDQAIELENEEVLVEISRVTAEQLDQVVRELHRLESPFRDD